jgi:hypothetical protein
MYIVQDGRLGAPVVLVKPESMPNRWHKDKGELKFSSCNNDYRRVMQQLHSMKGVQLDKGIKNRSSQFRFASLPV